MRTWRAVAVLLAQLLNVHIGLGLRNKTFILNKEYCDCASSIMTRLELLNISRE